MSELTKAVEVDFPLKQELWSEEKRASVEEEISLSLKDVDVEAQSLAPVLQRKNKTTTSWELFIVWFTASIKASSWSCGALAVLIYGLSPLNAVLSIIVGNIFGAIIVYLTASMGRNGMPQIMLMVPIFGHKGAKIPQFLLYITVLGWTIANTVFSTLIGVGIVETYFPSISKSLATTIAVGILFLLTLSSLYVANKRYDIAVKYLKPVTYLMIAILIVMTFLVFRDTDWTAQASSLASSGISLPIMFVSSMGALGIGYLGTWAPFAADFSRYNDSEGRKKQRKTGLISTFSATLCCTWLLSIGALFAHTYGGIDPAQHIAKAMPAFAIPALIVVLVGSWSTLVVNYMSNGIDLKSLGGKLNRKQCSSVNAVIVIVLSLITFFGVDIASAYNSFLLFLVMWMVPWVCIQAMDYFIVNDRDYSIRGIYGLDKTYGEYEWRAIVCMIVGFFSSWLFSNPGDIKLFGFLPLYSPLMRKYFHGGDFSFFVGATVTIILYYFLSVKPRMKKKRLVAA